MSTPEPVVRQPSCDDEYDPAWLPVDTALDRIAQAVTPIADVEVVALREALDRVLGADVHSPVAVPNHTNSAMDGYALRFADLYEASLQVVGTAWAGKAVAGSVGPGECVRIMTGGVMPEGTDTVVMQEHVEQQDDHIRVADGQRDGQQVRYAGEALAAGATALVAGRRLLPGDIGMVASLGIGELPVLRRPRVAFFSNGDELRSIGQPLELGDVYDSNRYTLNGMLRRAGMTFNDLGVVRDDREQIKNTFLKAAELCLL